MWQENKLALVLNGFLVKLLSGQHRLRLRELLSERPDGICIRAELWLKFLIKFR